jgi:hypothetical protein
MLFKEKYFSRIKSGMAQELDAFSLNSATSLLVIWDAVRHHFHDVDLGELVNLLQKNLASRDLLAAMPFEISPDVQVSFRENRFRLLTAKFYQYYLSRLPVFFRYNRFIRRGRKGIPSRREMHNIVHACVSYYSQKYHDVDSPLSPDDYRKFTRLARWYVRRKAREDQVYSIQWLWDILESTYPTILAANNTSSIAGHVIESCFPMYWNAFQDRHRYCMSTYASMGWFVGTYDVDIDEIDAALGQSDKPKDKSNPATRFFRPRPQDH